ncbi:malto-oligosyltrehalose trehalohydrolase [Siphonobacter sp.]|uniref:malto-oligosyltrehalose trehalohydrolase n=1 Tax=Siphonobacter sp. TaxID=1869184 RepID=UPI003B3B798B
MQSINLSSRTLGVNFSSTGEAHIVLWAPLLEHVAIHLTKSNTMYPLVKDGFGYWELTTTELQPGDTYQFVLNDGKHLPDPTSLSQPESVHSISEAVDLSDYDWHDQHWQNLPLADYIFYELHVGTFTPEGTFAALEEKLDHLISLGVTAIELMPIAQFPGKRNWGYDGVYPFAVQHSYGGVRGLQHLVDRCHQKGLAVILDVVYNHMGPDGNYFGQYGPYFTDKYSTPWGDGLNFDDEHCDGVRQFFIENVLMWFRDFHIDGLRLDAVHAIRDFSPYHILQEIKQHVDALSEQTGRTHYLIVEMDLNDTRYIKPMEQGGYAMDAQWSDEFHHALRVAAGEERMGYYEEMNGMNHLAKAFRDAYVYTGQYSFRRHKKFGVHTDQIPGEKFVVFSQNHDHVGNRMMGERTSQLVSFEMLKLLAGTVLCSPYLPLLFMGEEWAEENPFLYFVDHTDPKLSALVREGRRKEFAYFHNGDGEAPDPTIEETFQQSKLQWSLLEKEHHQTLFRYYQALIALRKAHPALKNLDRSQMEVVADEDRDLLIIRRWHEKQDVLILLNFSKQPQAVPVPEAKLAWHKRWDSADVRWNGPLGAPEVILPDSGLTIQPESILLYIHE